MDLSGHADRIEDYANIADLGVRALRIGLLWERHERDPSWSWEDERLNLLRNAGIRPIAGLLHHGSGPQHTSLLDQDFPDKLACYARQVAERYPWIEAYTPVNEPNTTARFSAMYGIWYPHHMSRQSFLRALCNEVKGTVLSMQAIRCVQPKAQLIQTEDVGAISGTEKLKDIWESLNLRQWLTFDLLCGYVDRDHPLFKYMCTAGITEREIYWFADNPCPPNVIGINYYPTSDRYLDHRVHLYPPSARSAEGTFADIEAVRISTNEISGVGALLSKAWRRYNIPLAITEVHLGSSVDEQIRWFAESYQQVLSARKRGVCCIALTAWALFGSYYWNELVTVANGYYEPGVFDVSSGVPVPTELVSVVRQAVQGKTPDHLAISEVGWWRRSNRLTFVPEGAEQMADLVAANG